jgi:hypothetical protein
MPVTLEAFSLERMVSAVDKVRDRLLRATGALSGAGVLYAVAGGNAVAAWVTRVDESAVRNTRDVDILLRRSDLQAARIALEAAGFIYYHTVDLDMFLDGPDAREREAVHIVFTGEKVRESDPLPNPDVTDSEEADRFRIISLMALVQNKLTAYRDKDRTHLRDLIDVGLIAPSRVDRFEPPLSERLQELIDNPEG